MPALSSSTMTGGTDTAHTIDSSRTYDALSMSIDRRDGGCLGWGS